MKYDIEFAVVCHKGYVREKNQDNFWCAEKFLESENEGLPELLSGKADISSIPTLAVFDGLGGEQQGEMAAYIAASYYDYLLRSKDRSDVKEFLLSACAEINRKICQYQQENGIRQMGTTAAMLMCAQEEIFICNVGDSRIYQYSGKKMTQISVDHSESNAVGRKSYLTQSLGIPESEFVIEPYIAKGIYRNGDRYLLCSDGLTDMVTDKGIEDVFSRGAGVSETAQTLMEMALENGGMDNITIVICEVQRQKRLFGRK